MNALDRLRESSDTPLSADDIFEAVFLAGSTLNDGDRASDTALEVAVRLLEARRNQNLPAGCSEVIEYLAEECGLYPYVDPTAFSLPSRSLIEAHALPIADGVYLHAKQMQVLLWLLNGDNVILSAPTSFGKTMLLDAFLQMRYPRTVVVIMPTIALIDETRRRVERNFGEKYAVITNSTDSYVEDRATIFILTQERFLSRSDIKSIDFLFVDEFYKLDPDRDDSRFETLNIALYRALPIAKHHFMAGPHVRSIELGDRWSGNFRFVQTDYKTVTVNIVDRSQSGGRLETFLQDIESVGDESCLVFCATPGSAQSLLAEMITTHAGRPTDAGEELGQWIADSYHADWPIAAGAKLGIAVHHGRIPRSLGQLFVRMFDKGVVKTLICTSTLIEGVNTSAANVFIYDKKINRTDFDFFSFANIRGRVGRMMRHFVGRAFLYFEPPEEIETNVDVPVLSDPGDATDYILVNVDGELLDREGRERQREIVESSGLPQEILAEHASMGIELLREIAEEIGRNLVEAPETLIWTGYPTKEQSLRLAEFALKVAHQKRQATGIHTPKQVTWAWDQLRAIKTLPAFLRWFSRTFYKDDVPAGTSAAFEFLQACEFSLPRTGSAVEALIKNLDPRASVNYGFYLAEMENWFRPKWMKQLDEAGIPLPIGEKLRPVLQGCENGQQAMARLRALDISRGAMLTPMDKRIIVDAL